MDFDAGVKLPETSYEQRKPIYKDVESLISPGFLSLPVTINGVKVSLRSFSPRDILLLSNRCGESNRDWMVWVLAQSTWMIGGAVVLDDINFPLELYDIYNSLPSSHIKKMFKAQSCLFRKMEASIEIAKAFSVEDVSRQMWRQNGNTPVNSPSLTGISGTDTLGMNVVQRIWVTYNTHQDIRESIDNGWSNSKFIASALNPKGVKKVEDREKVKDDRERDLKRDSLDSAFYKKMGVIADEDSLVDGRKLFKQVKSVNDLVTEYKDWVDGNLDFHDKVIMEYKESIKRRYDEEDRRIRESQMEITGDDVDNDDYGKIVVYDMNQMREILASQSGTKKIYDNPTMRRDIFDKHIGSEVIQPPSVGSLQDQISGRNPTFKSK